MSIFIVNAQPMEDNIDSVFADLKPPSGILYNKIIFPEIVAFDYDGILNNTISSEKWKSLYDNMYHSQITSDILIPIEELTQIAETYLVQGKIPILVMDLEYDQLEANAFDSGAITSDGTKLVEIENPTSSPYASERLFVVAPYIGAFDDTEIEFVFPEELYFTNTSNTQSDFKVDFGDGYGERSISINQSILITYHGIRDNAWSITSTYLNGDILQGSTSFTNMGIDPYAYGSFGETPPDFQFSVNEVYGANVYGLFGCENNQLSKPFIFVEGIDFRRHGDQDPNYEYRNGEFGWDTFLSGVTFPKGDPQILAKMPTLIQRLLNQGYDVLYVDFKNGGSSVKNNGKELAAVIEEVNRRLTANNSSSSIVLAGASMGGLVSRYALTYMENRSIDHNTGLWISIDAPHKGANIPIGLQYYIDFFHSEPKIREAKKDLREKFADLNSDGAKEMLIYHYTTNNSVHPLRQALLDDPDFIFPELPKKMAIANGGGLGIGIGYNPGDQTIDFKRKIDRFSLLFANMEANTWAVYGDGVTNRVFWGKIYYWPTIFVPVTNLANKNETKWFAADQPYDNAPGGVRNSNKDGSEGQAIHDSHCFIPTISALSLNIQDVNRVVLGPPLDATYPDVPPPLKASYTPFDVIHVPETNEGHIMITDDNINAILNQLEQNELFLYNENVEGERHHSANRIVVSSNNSNGDLIGSYFANTNANIEMVASQRIEFKSDVTIVEGAKLIANIDPNAGPIAPCVSSSGNSGNSYNNQITYELDNHNIVELTSDLSVYPNPFSTSTTIKYSVEEDQQVSLVVYNLYGQKVKEVISGTQSAGTYNYELTKDDLAPGTYLVELLKGNQRENKKVVLLK